MTLTCDAQHGGGAGDPPAPLPRPDFPFDPEDDSGDEDE